MNRRSRLAALLACSAALGGCSVASTQQDLDTYRAAKPCCADVGALPAPTVAVQENELKLGPAAPHFDLGFGLAPFARLRIDPSSMKYVSLLAYPRPSARLGGGDGSFHYADLRIVFFDKQGTRLAPAELSAPVIRTHGFAGTYMLIRHTTVPDGAAIAVVTTNPADAGKRGSASTYVPGGGMMIKGTFIPMPGGSQNQAYTWSMYGDAILLTSEQPPKT